MVSSGHGRGTVYTLKVATSDGKDATLDEKDATSNGSWVMSPMGSWDVTPTGSRVITSEGTRVITSEGSKDATSDGKDATSDGKDATSISLRMSKEELKSEIISYCSEWRTAAEIASYLGKTKSYIRNRVLPQMSDVLQMRFSKENHPGQKYKVKD